MKQVVRKLVIGRQVSINTKENDSVDIRCGGPHMLGYDFVVDFDEKPGELRKFIEKCFKECNKSFLSIHIDSSRMEVPKTHIWSRDKIKKCIKTEDP